MNWLFWLTAAVALTAVVAVSGMQPTGTRPIAHTRMMSVARLVLLVLVVIFAFAAFRARTGG